MGAPATQFGDVSRPFCCESFEQETRDFGFIDALHASQPERGQDLQDEIASPDAQQPGRF